MMSKARLLHGITATILLLAPLALVHCNDKDKNLTAPTKSGSLSVSIGATPPSGRAPLDVAFTSEVSGGTGQYIYSWSFGDGTSSSEANPHVRFANGGVYNTTLKVVSGGESVVSGAVAVRVDGDVRLACFIDPEEGSVPHTVNFTADALGGNGQFTYLWRFGDGATSADVTTQHTYSSVGTYLATLTATSGGTSSASSARSTSSRRAAVAGCRGTKSWQQSWSGSVLTGKVPMRHACSVISSLSMPTSGRSTGARVASPMIAMLSSVCEA